MAIMHPSFLNEMKIYTLNGDKSPNCWIVTIFKRDVSFFPLYGVVFSAFGNHPGFCRIMAGTSTFLLLHTNLRVQSVTQSRTHS